ncbi:hypothetical protein [Pseudoclavibacter sp. 13-3]|uniref:hypothetical protein n=1 Tax=Pseudoclavibacter sp. 13-3 TaxID=2901228 RepID=UPI001E4547A4|nr:hypothetical protein [Pseudoclavibacter sp. 13-3]MCD7100745.1 hypothetical protein [Pseudoclavibacter sp. 13-3]
MCPDDQFSIVSELSNVECLHSTAAQRDQTMILSTSVGRRERADRPELPGSGDWCGHRLIDVSGECGAQRGPVVTGLKLPRAPPSTIALVCDGGAACALPRQRYTDLFSKGHGQVAATARQVSEQCVAQLMMLFLLMSNGALGLVEFVGRARGESECHNITVVPAVSGVPGDDVDGLPHIASLIGELEDVDASAWCILRGEQGGAGRPLLAHVESCEMKRLHSAFLAVCRTDHVFTRLDVTSSLWLRLV